MTWLQDIGWNEFFEEQREQLDESGICVARVINGLRVISYIWLPGGTIRRSEFLSKKFRVFFYIVILFMIVEAALASET